MRCSIFVLDYLLTGVGGHVHVFKLCKAVALHVVYRVRVAVSYR